MEQKQNITDKEKSKVPEPLPTFSFKSHVNWLVIEPEH
jgi:hypothetical protein